MPPAVLALLRNFKGRVKGSSKISCLDIAARAARMQRKAECKARGR
jgi:hypothetical protein